MCQYNKKSPRKNLIYEGLYNKTNENSILSYTSFEFR